jgi:hypothetical protein
VDSKRLKVSNRQFGDFKKIHSNEGFTASESHNIHARQLLKDCFNFFYLQVVMTLEFPGVAHDATGIASKSDGVGKQPWEDCSTTTQLVGIVKESWDPTQRRE